MSFKSGCENSKYLPWIGLSCDIPLITDVVSACKQTCYIVKITLTRMIATYLAQWFLSPGHKTLLSSLSSISCPNNTILSPEKHIHPSLC